jgi:hypothetical protein
MAKTQLDTEDFEEVKDFSFFLLKALPIFKAQNRHTCLKWTVLNKLGCRNKRVKDIVQPKKRGVKRGTNWFASTSYTVAHAFRYIKRAAPMP